MPPRVEVKRGAMSRAHPRTIEVAEDTFLVATVQGKRPLTPVLTAILSGFCRSP